MTNSQLYEWGWYINPASHGTFVIDSNDREVALKHLLETLGVKSLPEYAVLHCWTTDHPTLEAHELRAENEHMKECLELRANAVKTYTNLYHEAQAKLAMMSEALKSADPYIKSLYQSSINTRNQGLGEQHSCNPEVGCDGLCMDAYQAGLVTGMIHRALAATAEDLERWKEEQQEIVRLSVTESLARKLEVLADKCEAGDAVRRENNLIYAAWIRSNA